MRNNDRDRLTFKCLLFDFVVDGIFARVDGVIVDHIAESDLQPRDDEANGEKRLTNVSPTYEIIREKGKLKVNVSIQFYWL